MIRRSGSGAQRRRWVLWMALVLVVCVAALIGYAKWTTSRQRQAIDTALQEKEARNSKQVAALEEARRTLPPDAGIPQDWSLGEWAQTRSVSTFINRRTWARAFLLAPTPFPPTLFSEKAFSELQEQVQNILNASPGDAVYQHLDQRTHTPAEIFSALGDLVSAIEDIRTLESALEHGLVVPIPDSNSGQSLYTLNMAADLIAFRAWAEAARGQVDEAIVSLRHAFALTRIAATPSSPTVRYIYCHAALRKVIDEAWKHVPMSEEQRARLMQSVDFSDRDRLIAFLHSVPAELADQKPEALPGIEEFPTPLLRAAISYGYNTYCRLPQTGAADGAIAFAGLVDQRPIDALPKIKALAHGLPRFATQTREWLGEVIAHDLYVWRCAAAPDIVRFVCALKDYRNTHSAYPEDLANTGGAMRPPEDPATGLPMEYKSDGKTFSLTFPLPAEYPMPIQLGTHLAGDTRTRYEGTSSLEWIDNE